MFNFQGSISLPLSRQLVEYITFIFPCQYPFLTFFKFFRVVSKSCFCDIPFSQTLAPLPLRKFVYRILSLVSSLVNTFFLHFLTFSLLSVHLPTCFCSVSLLSTLYIVSSCAFSFYSLYLVVAAVNDSLCFPSYKLRKKINAA